MDLSFFALLEWLRNDDFGVIIILLDVSEIPGRFVLVICATEKLFSECVAPLRVLLSAPVTFFACCGHSSSFISATWKL